jgi:ATP-dependent RNA helicase CshB
MSTLPFASYALPSELVASLAKFGYLYATDVQQLVIPRALKGDSLIARFETGSGKTHAFLIPLIATIKQGQGLQAIIFSPTRELANQTHAFCTQITKDFNPLLKTSLLTGGYDKQKDIEKLNPLPEILVTTPGRLPEILKSIPNYDFKMVKKIILDEADMLLDDSFVSMMTSFLTMVQNPQIMVFSASISPTLLSLLKDYIRPDAVIEQPLHAINPNRVQHHLIDIKHLDTANALSAFIKHLQPYLVIVFASTVDRVVALHDALKAQGHDVALLHGSLTQRERKQIVKRIKEGEFSIVVASDIASRGIDIDHVSDVISVDLPKDLTYYFHRAGRTGRFDKLGHSYVFYNSYEDTMIKTLLAKGVVFDYAVFKGGELKPVASFDRQKQFIHKEDVTLKRDIKVAIQKYSSHQVKPGYKKKVKLAIDKVRRKHKRKAINDKIKKRIYGDKL